MGKRYSVALALVVAISCGPREKDRVTPEACLKPEEVARIIDVPYLVTTQLIMVIFPVMQVTFLITQGDECVKMSDSTYSLNCTISIFNVKGDVKFDGITMVSENLKFEGPTEFPIEISFKELSVIRSGTRLRVNRLRYTLGQGRELTLEGFIMTFLSEGSFPSVTLSISLEPISDYAKFSQKSIRNVSAELRIKWLMKITIEGEQQETKLWIEGDMKKRGECIEGEFNIKTESWLVSSEDGKLEAGKLKVSMDGKEATLEASGEGLLIETPCGEEKVSHDEFYSYFCATL